MVRFDYSKHKPTYSLNDFEFLHDPKDKNSKLGTGSFATVKLAKDKSGKLYALKMIDTGHSRFSKTDLENLKLEIDIHKCLDHPNIIKFHGYIQDNNVIYLVLDYAENGNLYTYLHRKKILTEKEIFRFFHQTCLAIHHLHQNNIVHRDIKPENLLLDKDFNIKICDFGWSAYDIRRERETFCGTYEYMAPEIVQKKPYDYRVDIWAVGILLYELIHNKAPYKGRSLHEIKNSLNKGEISFNPNISQNAKELIQSILKDKPSKRISMIQILTDRWVNDHLEKEESFRRSVYLESINFLAHQNDTENESEKNTEESQSNPLSFFAKAIQQMFKSEEPVLRKAESNILPQIEDLPTTNNFILQKSKSTNEKLMKDKSSPNKSARTPKKTKKIFEGVTLTPRFQNRLNQIIKNVRSKRNSEISPRQEDSSASTSNSTLEVNIIPKTATALDKSSQSPLLQAEPQVTNLLVENSHQPKEMTSKPVLIEKSIKISLKNISNFGNVVKDMKQEEDKFKAPSSALLERNKNSGQENSRKRIFDRADYLKNIKLEVHKTVSNKLTDLHSANEVRSSSWFNGKNNKENVSGLSIGARNI